MLYFGSTSLCLDRLPFVFNACKGWSRRSVPKLQKWLLHKNCMDLWCPCMQGHPGQGILPLDISVLTFLYYLDLYYFVSKYQTLKVYCQQVVLIITETNNTYCQFMR